MTFWENVLHKGSAILKAALGLAIFICVEYAIYSAFSYLAIDRDIYRGCYNFLVSIANIVAMLIIWKISNKKDDPFIKVNKLPPDQFAALTAIALGMLGFVTFYIIAADMISAYLESLKEAMVEYRENVDRYAETPQIVIPLWDSLLYIFTVSFIVPVSEELIFRGVIFGYLRRAFKPWIAVIMCAFAFGIMHGVSVHIGYALVCGFIIAACYHLTDSIFAPILLHTIFNIFGSGIVNFMTLEQMRIPKEVSSAISTGLNVSSLLFMPVGVLAFAYLINAKRKKDAAAKQLEEYIAVREEMKKEENDMAEEAIELSEAEKTEGDE